MKKSFLFIFLVILIIGLNGCNNKVDPNMDNSQPTNSDNSIDNTDNPDSSEELEEFYYTGDILSVYFDEKYNDIDIVNKFLGTMIVNVRPKEYRNFDIPIISSKDEDYDLMFSLLHLNPEIIEEFAISVSSNPARAYTIAFLKVTSLYEESVINSLNQRIVDLYSQVEDYPDQIYLVENSILISIGEYIVLIICDNAEDVYYNFVQCMSTQNLNMLEVVPYMTEEERLEIENESLNEEIMNIESQIDDLYLEEIKSN